MSTTKTQLLYANLQDDEAGFEKEWLKLEKYNFKLLTLVAVLAQNHLAYRGTVAEMCDYLGINNQTKNRRAITTAIAQLEKKGMVKTILDGKVYTITLSVKAEKKKDVIVIQKKWIEMVQGLTTGVTWDNVLRVWLYLIANEEEIITSKKIAADLGMSKSMVDRIKIILVSDLKAIKCQNRAKKISEGNFQKLGQTIDTFAWID